MNTCGYATHTTACAYMRVYRVCGMHETRVCGCVPQVRARLHMFTDCVTVFTHTPTHMLDNETHLQEFVVIRPTTKSAVCGRGFAVC